MFSRNQLLRSNLFCYWRSHLAVMLGVVAGTAVITGALIVGDSVRQSLNRLTLLRLGRVDHLLTGPRFFREDLAGDLQKKAGEAKLSLTFTPALIFSAGLQHSNEQGDQTVRANRVNLYGFDQRAWDLLDHPGISAPVEQQIFLNERTARQLSVKTGDEIVVSVALPAAVPRDSLLGKKDSTTTQIPFVVTRILSGETGASRFGIRADQQIPMNAFVSLGTLQTALSLESQRPTRENPEEQLARVNSLLVATPEQQLRGLGTAAKLNRLLEETVELRDLDLRIVPRKDYNYLALESRRMVLEPSLVDSGTTVARSLQLRSDEVLVSLANQIRNPKVTDPKSGYAMYSTVAGMNLSADHPFRKEDFVGPVPSFPLQGRDILINEWLASDLKAKIGDEIELKYFIVGSRGELPELTEKFTVRGILGLEGKRGSDRGLVPVLKGITDAKRLADWDQPFEMQFNLITARDEEYWEKYKATPKAFVSLETAQDLWKSRYGKVTSVLLTPAAGESLEEAQSSFEQALRVRLPLSETGLQFQSVKAEGLSASAGTTDFSGLFFGFSLFLIAAASILVGLLFRLGLERRSSEIGLLMAVGMTPRLVGRLFFLENLIVLILGGVLGSVAAIAYAGLMIRGLTTLWVGAIRTTELKMHLTPAALIAGFFITFGIAVLTISLGLRRNRLLSLRGLLGGATLPEMSVKQQQSRRLRSLLMAGVTLLSAGLLLLANLARLLPAAQAFGGLSWDTVTFFLAGFLLLVGCQNLLAYAIDSDRVLAVRGRGFTALRRLGLRNASRNRSRTVQTVGLISTATFMIVAVAAGQRNPSVELPEKNSGNGGFTLIAESDTPILYDLNSSGGRNKLGLDEAGVGELLRDVTIIPFRMNPGDNASCLNLYQSRLPTILGAPSQMIDRGGFRFVDPPAGNPWKILERPVAEKQIPVIGDMNTLMYSMHKGVGQSLPVNAQLPGKGELLVSGMFADSVFQGVLVMSEQNFLATFPEEAGFRYFLIDAPVGKSKAVSDLLESRLGEYGFDVDRVADRLTDFLSVQNTYLSTFQTLGGLGLLLGTLGLATVMLRNVLERQGEIALLQGVGFRRGQITALLLWETASLLGWGLVSGTLSALLAMLPHLAGSGSDVPWLAGAMTFVTIFAAGMLASWGAIRTIDRIPVLQTLKAERM